MFCGTRSFSRVDGGGGGWKKTTSTTRSTKIISDEKKKKNPYAGRGLDKFYALLADLDARKQKITGAGDSLRAIWFEYSSSHDWIPLVVKLPAEPWRSSREEEKKKKRRSHCDGQAPAGQKTREAVATVPAVAPVEEEEEDEEESGRGEGKYYLFWSMEVVLGLILLCLAMAGRSFAICCTILWWYFVPVGGGRRKNMKKTAARRTMSLDRSMGRRSAVPSQQQKAIIGRGTSNLSALHG